MFRSILGQMVCQIDDLKPEIDALYRKCGNGPKHQTKWNYKNVLKELVEYFEKVYVVVDALDESVERSEFPDFLLAVRNCVS